MKYYIKIEDDNSIIRPYINEKDIPNDGIEVSKEIVDEYLQLKNKGFVVYFIDNELKKVYYKLTEDFLINKKIDEIKLLLKKTDTTQLLDNRLTESIRIQFENYRQNLRNIIKQLELKEVLHSSVILPEVPSYE